MRKGEKTVKKKLWIPLLVLALAVVLFVPIPRGVYRDGGTREYAALTYKLVDWNRLYRGGVYEKTRLYLFPDNFKSVDTLWEQEQEQLGTVLRASVEQLTDTEVILRSVGDGTRYRMAREQLGKLVPELGSVLELRYSGALLYSDPPMISGVISCREAEDLRPLEYTKIWLDKDKAEKTA